MTIDLDELERLAKAATPGEWRSIDTAPAGIRGCDSIHFGPATAYAVNRAYGRIVATVLPCTAADAEYIAAVSPTVVLALVEKARKLVKWEAALAAKAADETAWLRGEK